MPVILPREGLSNVPRAANVTYMAVALFTAATTTSLGVLRAQMVLRVFGVRHLKPLHILTLFVYFLGISFSTVAAICYFGVELTGSSECYSAIIICLIFYLGQKFFLYLFLVERTHAVRSRNTPRHKNWVYIFGLVVVIVGFGIVAVLSFLWSAHSYDVESGICYIGLPPRLALSLLSYDIFVHIFLTAVFLYYVRPYLSGSFRELFVSIKNDQQQEPNGHDRVALPQSHLKKVMRKSFFGCILITFSTIVNLSVLVAMEGHQQAWMCLTFCTLDVLWGVAITHWLTSTPEEMANSIRSTAHTTAPRRSRVISGMYAVRSRAKSESQTEMTPHGPHPEVVIEYASEPRTPTDDKSFPSASHSEVTPHPE